MSGSRSGTSYYDLALIDTPAKAAEKLGEHLRRKGNSMIIGEIKTHGEKGTGFDVSVTISYPSGASRQTKYFVPPRGPVKLLANKK